MTPRLDPKKDPERRCLKVEQWPDADRVAWATVIKPGNLLDDAGLGGHWSRHTSHTIARCYGGWLTWLDRNGILDRRAGPADRVTPERIVRYIDDLRLRNAPLTVLSRIRELCNAIQAMAPDRDWGWLQKIIRRLRRNAKPKRRKAALIVPSEHLWRYGIELMDAADAVESHKPPLSRAAQYRDGLVISLLAARPIRRRNLASIEIGRHLIHQGERYWICFPAAETKTGRPYAAPLPLPLNRYLERYLAHYRPFLIQHKGRWGESRSLQEPGDRLWISNYASAMSEGALYGRVTKLTGTRFGHKIFPHLFRDVAATSITVEAPEHVQIIPGHLGHSTSATSEKHYVHARSLEATRKYQAHLLGLRVERPRGASGANR